MTIIGTIIIITIALTIVNHYSVIDKHDDYDMINEW